MVRSLLIKLAMLAVTLGSLIWIGSVTPIRQVTPSQAQPTAAAPIAVASRPSMNDPSPATAPSQAAGVLSERLNSRTPGGMKPSELPPSSGSSQATIHDSSRKVDLNHATAADLEALPGIGPKLAQRVIEHRTSNGPFMKVEDLRRVKGIGHKKFDRLRSHVLVTPIKAPSGRKGTL